MREWPGLRGPLVHVPDPLSPSSLIESVAARIAPHWRVLSISLRAGVPYQVSAVDLLGVILQFGFEDLTLLGEGFGCVTALVFSAWYPEHVSQLILVKPKWHAADDSFEARVLRDCPPDLPAVRSQLRCQVREVGSAEEVAATLP